MMNSYLDKQGKPYPFCPGCTHGVILDAIGRALHKNGTDPKKVVLVSDIGCVGLADQFFQVHTFHGLHGRSFTYASGIKLADPSLEVFVLVGDGGCGIGGHHLINAARRNLGIKVICFNNFNFGMTGGEHSVTTPHGGITHTTSQGNLENPFDLSALVLSAGATFVSRKTAFEKDLDETIAAAFVHKGFAFVEVWEICSPYYAAMNEFKVKEMAEYLEKQGYKKGLMRREEKDELATLLNSLSSPSSALRAPSPQREKVKGIEKKFNAAMSAPHFDILLAGSAGMKVVSAAGLFAKAGLLCGLWAVQKDDYPVTIQSGHSTSLVKFARDKIHYMGSTHPNVVLLNSDDGLRKIKRELSSLTPDDLVIYTTGLSSFETKARRIEVDLKGARVKPTNQAVALIAFFLTQKEILSIEALKTAIEMIPKEKIRSENLGAFETGLQLGRTYGQLKLS